MSRISQSKRCFEEFSGTYRNMEKKQSLRKQTLMKVYSKQLGDW